MKLAHLRERLRLVLVCEVLVVRPIELRPAVYVRVPVQIQDAPMLQVRSGPKSEVACESLVLEVPSTVESGVLIFTVVVVLPAAGGVPVAVEPEDADRRQGGQLPP